MKLVEQAAKYGLTGALNTFVGLSAIYVCMAMGLGDVSANAIGYLVGLMVSYLLNARWTFGFRGSHAQAMLRFLLIAGLAYAANLAAMLSMRDWGGVNSHVAQLCGVAVYAAVGFVGSGRYAFVR